MSALARIIPKLARLLEGELLKIEEMIQDHRHLCPFHATKVRIAGLYHINAQGDFEMPEQQLNIGVSYTAALVFTDASGNTGAGPIGTVTASDHVVTASLSADGQSLNVTATAVPTAPVSIVWHDPSGSIADTDLIDITAEATGGGTGTTFVATSVALAGELAEGTTA